MPTLVTTFTLTLPSDWQCVTWLVFISSTRSEPAAGLRKLLAQPHSSAALRQVRAVYLFMVILDHSYASRVHREGRKISVLPRFK